MLSTDASIFLLVPRSDLLRISDEQLIYLAKQLFKKASSLPSNTGFGTGNICGAVLDSRNIYIRTCRIKKHVAMQYWFEDLCKQAHIQATLAPPITEASELNPTN